MSKKPQPSPMPGHIASHGSCLWICGHPVAQPRPRAAAVNGKARVYQPSGAAKQYKKHIALRARQVFAEPLSGPVSLELWFCMPRPKARTWKTKPMPREWHTSRPDVDNLMKAVMDALNGVAWQDDSQVCETLAVKCVAAGSDSVGVWIAVTPVGSFCPPGIPGV